MNSNNDDNDNGNGNTKSIVLEDFHNPTNTWSTLNDPVMGGRSYSNVELDTAAGVAKFSGECAIVPSLQAPGFITMQTGGKFGDKPAKFPDISTCSAFQFELKTNTEYSGYRVSFGKAHAKGGRFAYGYKAPLLLDEDLPPVGEFGSVVIPFKNFSDKWNDATGDIEIECADNPTYCPSQQWLQTMETMSFWAEGVEGIVDLEVKSISAIGCGTDASENAVAPSMVKSKMHSISSNPAYMATAVALTILACIVGSCLYCCFCCGRASKNKTMQSIDAPITSTFKDSAGTDGFSDEVVDSDLEQS